MKVYEYIIIKIILCTYNEVISKACFLSCIKFKSDFEVTTFGDGGKEEVVCYLEVALTRR